MKKTFLFVLCILLLFPYSASAAIGSKGLIVNRGATEIVLQKGEKEWLFVQDGFSKLPLLKGLSFYSDNTVIFTVGLHSGVIRGNSLGSAKLTVVSKQGHCAYVTVKVVSPRKSELKVLAFLLLTFGIPIFIIIRKKH